MERVKVSLTQALLDQIDLLVASGLYASRGEVVREAIRRFLRRERG